MGNCFYCRPQTLVTEDPDVTIFTEVGFCVMMFPSGDFTTYCQAEGLVYVKNQSSLYLESTIGDRFCCLCCRSDWSLSDITQVEMVTGNITVTRRNRYRVIDRTTHSMNPGVRITFKHGGQLVMQTARAENFCTQLRRLCNLPNLPIIQVVLENVLLQAIAGSDRRIQAYRRPLAPSKSEDVQPLLN